MGFLGRGTHVVGYIRRAKATSHVGAEIFWPKDPGSDLFVARLPIYGFDLERIKDCDILIEPATSFLTIVAKKSITKPENGPVAVGGIPTSSTRPTGVLAADYE